MSKMDELLKSLLPYLDAEGQWIAMKKLDEIHALYKEVVTERDKLKEKYNNLCDKLDYEEGWDPREEDEQCGQ